MKKLFLFLICLCFIGCSTIFQYTKPHIIEVESIDDIPTECQPVFLNSFDATGKYYMEVVFTQDLPEFGWIAIETGTLVFEVVPAFPKKAFRKIVGVAKEPAYKLVDSITESKKIQFDLIPPSPLGY